MNIILKSSFAFACILSGCTIQKEYVYEAQPVEITMQEGTRTPTGGRSCFQVDRHFVWGSSVLQAEDGRYYMVYSAPEATDHTFNNAWVLGSKFGLAVSSTPDGNFKQLGFFYNNDGFTPDSTSWDAQTVMNPHLRKFNDKYYLYYVGGSDPGDVPIKSSTEQLDSRSRIQQSLQIGVIEFDSFTNLLKGDFVRHKEPLLAPRTRVKPDNIVNPSPEGTIPKPDNIITVNPSVVYRPSDKKYLLYFKGNIYDPHWRGVHGVALSDSSTGPFVALDTPVFDVPVSGNEKLSAEDPFVWYSKKDQLFYAVFKDFTGKFTKAGPCLAIMYSVDGIDWLLPENSLFMKKELVLSTGDTLKVARLERPQLLLNSQDIPIVLYGACAIEELNDKKDGSSFNVQIGLKRKTLYPRTR